MKSFKKIKQKFSPENVILWIDQIRNTQCRTFDRKHWLQIFWFDRSIFRRIFKFSQNKNSQNGNFYYLRRSEIFKVVSPVEISG